MEITGRSMDVRFRCWNPLRNHGKTSRQLAISDFKCWKNDSLWNGMTYLLFNKY